MNSEHENNVLIERRTIDLFIKLLLILTLISWSGLIILPFTIPLLWAVILAITVYPMYRRLLKVLNGKKGLTGTIVVLLLLCILLLPTILMISSIVDEAKELKTSFENNTFKIPPPNEKVADWPLVGDKVYKEWSLASKNLDSAMVTHRDEVMEWGQKIVNSVKSVFSNILMFAFSIIISGIFLVFSDECQRAAGVLSNRLVANRGEEFSKLVVQTVRNVSKGILGVAFIQFIIMGICFVLAGVPFAGIWALLVFLLALVQLPGAIVAIPVIIYLYSVREPLPATIWGIIILICGLSDNVLKPLLMGKGAPVPMVVIFLGAIGGFMLSGFVGLFTGAIVLSLGYKLAGIWVNNYVAPPAKNE